MYFIAPFFASLFLILLSADNIDLPNADDMDVCGVCQTTYFFAYEEKKLAQREAIYHELADAVRCVIQHNRTQHKTQQTIDEADTKNTAADSHPPPDSDAACKWRYGCGVVSPESVSDVCFGAAQTQDRYTRLEDIATHIVDMDSAQRLYRKYDEKTGLLVQCRRSDRMIDESMNRRDFDATPVLLHCGHTVCRGCAYKCVRAHENAKYDTLFAMVRCPLRCDRKTAFVCDLGVEWLPVDIRRIRLLRAQKKASRKPICSHSEHKDRLATSQCTHPICAKFALMCEECDKAEHSSRNNRDHVRVSPSQMAPSSAAASVDSLCSKHQQPLAGVCMTDGVPVCGECLFDHMGHQVKRLHEVCSDWSTKLETLQRETLVRAHVLSDRAAAVQHRFDEMVNSINTQFDSVVGRATTRRYQLLFEARKWRKMQLEEAKTLAAESSRLSATAMYERALLLQRVLQPQPSDAVASDAVLGSAARQAQASGSTIESQSTQLNSDIAAMQTEDMNVIFDKTTCSAVMDYIQDMGTITVDPAQIDVN
jgi:B-box zinc finger